MGRKSADVASLEEGDAKLQKSGFQADWEWMERGQ
jgi:hypothetical protein